MTIEINVTCNDIAKGWALEATRCPIARAANRKMKGWGAAVALGRIIFTRRYGPIIFERMVGTLPTEATEFIAQFDAGNRGEPIRFPVTLESAPV